MPHELCGFAAAHGGKPPAYRGADQDIQGLCLRIEGGGAASKRRVSDTNGKPEAFRYVLRQSRDLYTTKAVLVNP